MNLWSRFSVEGGGIQFKISKVISLKTSGGLQSPTPQISCLLYLSVNKETRPALEIELQSSLQGSVAVFICFYNDISVTPTFLCFLRHHAISGLWHHSAVHHPQITKSYHCTTVLQPALLPSSLINTPSLPFMVAPSVSQSRIRPCAQWWHKDTRANSLLVQLLGMN